MTTETRYVYIADDGKEFTERDKCLAYEQRHSVLVLKSKLAKKIEERDAFIRIKNTLKANKHGELPFYERNIKYCQEEIEKITRKRAKNISLNEIDALRCLLMELKRYRIEKNARIKQLNETRERIKKMKRDIDGLAMHIITLQKQK